MSLFVERGTTKTFTFENPEYYAGVSIPGGNSKWRLLKRLDALNPANCKYIIPKYEVTRSWDDTFQFRSMNITYYVKQGE